MKRLILTALPVVAVSGCGTPPPSPGPAPAPPSSQIGRAVQTTHASRVASGANRRSNAMAPPPLAESEPVPQHKDLPAARRIARRFVGAYVRFLYGQLRERRSSTPTPSFGLSSVKAMRSSLPRSGPARSRILRITVTPAGPPVSALATATFHADGQLHQLTATLEPHGESWIVVAVDG